MNFLLTEGIGWIEVVTGSMFSGKSEELIRRLRRAKYGNQKLVAFKHASDVRYEETKLSSHDNVTIKGVPVSSVSEMERVFFDEYSDVSIVGIDEVQFFGEDVVAFCEKLANMGKRVIVAGLDMDFRGEPFKPMDALLSKAEYVDKFHAVCSVCGNPALVSQRLVNGEPAYYDDPIVLVGAKESYEARCRKCHIVKDRKSKKGDLIFVVGTGSRVGKTEVILELIQKEQEKNKKVGALKPIDTLGSKNKVVIEDTDAYKYSSILGVSRESINQYTLTKNLHPKGGANIDGERIDILNIKNSIDNALLENDITFVEGTKGIFDLIHGDYKFIDLLVDYRKSSEIIVVSDLSNSAINNTLLTLDVLKRNDTMIKGVVLNYTNTNDVEVTKEIVASFKELKDIAVLFHKKGE